MAPDALQPVEPGYRNVLRARAAVRWLVLTVLAVALDRLLLKETGAYGILSVLVPLSGTLFVLVSPPRAFRRLGYALDETLLRVARGWLFHTDTVVPLVRVQHLDVTRGPLDKAFGTASLVVHTAGTHNSIVTLPGLSPDRAAEIRDIIREHVRTDFA
ncbi:PH domain-containing protein [Sphingomonas sinipercae]|uniref:PH domain-containing protein n=1 Tax=Sphingomonas sinipercae TaxID=2714944 RepID=A0A6G7ZQV0_9SPHN|nr:PH domain-containing protein [Sphingomonas sinipercae]